VAQGDLGGGVALGLGQLPVVAGDLGEELRRQALVRAMAVVGLGLWNVERQDVLCQGHVFGPVVGDADQRGRGERLSARRRFDLQGPDVPVGETEATLPSRMTTSCLEVELVGSVVTLTLSIGGLSSIVRPDWARYAERTPGSGSCPPGQSSRPEILPIAGISGRSTVSDDRPQAHSVAHGGRTRLRNGAERRETPSPRSHTVTPFPIAPVGTVTHRI
jgi:hypothetical protein